MHRSNVENRHFFRLGVFSITFRDCEGRWKGAKITPTSTTVRHNGKPLTKWSNTFPELTGVSLGRRPTYGTISPGYSIAKGVETFDFFALPRGSGRLKGCVRRNGSTFRMHCSTNLSREKEGCRDVFNT
jgi:hypothetical protein